MNWSQWPFYPKALTQMIGPTEREGAGEEFFSLLASGCTERLGRSLTILEPEINENGDRITELDPDDPAKRRLRFRRIRRVNPREHFAKFCLYLRDLLGQDEVCHESDERNARRVFAEALEDPHGMDNRVSEYLCQAGLIDQAAVILCYETPVAVVLSGQFLPDDTKARQLISIRIDELAQKYHFDTKRKEELCELVNKLDTRDEFVLRYMKKATQRNLWRVPELEKPDAVAPDLLLHEVKHIGHIANTQFQMHKRDLESSFRHRIRQELADIPGSRSDREAIARKFEDVLHEVQQFCGVEYLVLFVSPHRFISYESQSHLLQPLVMVGLESEVPPDTVHFNWRKAVRRSRDWLPIEKTSEEEGIPSYRARNLLVLGQHSEASLAIKRDGLRGEQAALFENAAALYPVYLSDAYRAILLWGPFSHLNSEQISRERPFLEEVSDLVARRALGLIQLSDSERRTETWEAVASLLGHHSRRAMTPVSIGVRIISTNLQGEKTYTREEALAACHSLEAASRFIAYAVRAPLFSFAAMAENVYEFIPYSLGDTLRECVDLYLPTAMQKKVDITLDSSVHDLPDIELDPQKMRDAIGYVLDNAIKYSHPDKEVRIYGRQIDDSRVRLTIEDFGQGIRDDEMSRIFDRGYQGERSRKSLDEEGAGMGLFHARLIIAAHKGKILVRCHSGPRTEDSSRLEGYVVQFTFVLPVKQTDD
jgi:signal transduction histidine kinase/ligand-binding sensor protein